MRTKAKRSYSLLLALLALAGLTGYAHRLLTRPAAPPGVEYAADSAKRMRSLNATAAKISLLQTGNFDIPQSAILSGGGRSIGGNFDLIDSIGQILAGTSTGGAYTLTDGIQSGFVVPTGAQTITVNTTNDTSVNGFCSLRDAIQAANTNRVVNGCGAGVSGMDSIVFSLGTAAPVINITSALPAITEPVVLDGGAARVEVNGGNLGANIPGLNITAGNTIIRGMVINRFTGAGIQITLQGGNTIQNCLIGANAAGTAALPNALGILIDNSANNLIGGPSANTRNVIAGNTQDGIQIRGLSATGNQILGNSIGTDANGTLDLGNQTGVNITRAPNNIVGGSSVAERNLISGNNGCGVNIDQVEAAGNLVQGNFIGTNANGTTAIANSVGVCITAAPNNAIGSTAGTTPGGACTGACNLISGNNRGVELSGAGAGGNVIRGNFIGARADGTAPLPNTSFGVRINDAPRAVIGGIIPGARNVISGNGGANISISGALATDHQIQGNFIGTNSAGAQGLSNGSNGIEINAARNVIIGGTQVEARNVISGHASAAGVSIVSASSNQVRGNYIGTSADGASAVPNSIGISRIESLIGTGQDNLIGGADAGAGNLISGNTSAGVQLQGQNDRVQGNLIGTNATGTGAIPNFIGINLNNGTAINNLIGDTNIQPGATCTGACNKIAFNTRQGVLITAANNTGNRIWGNSLFSNGALGLDLDLTGSGGITPNDPGDGDAGPNGLQNFPVLTGALTLGAGANRTTTFQGLLNSASSKLYRIEFFANSACDPSGNGEGQRFLGFTNITTDNGGNAIINVTLPTPSGIAAGDFVTATATDVTANNTSEFSACLPVFSFIPAAAAFTRFANTGSFAFTTAPSSSWTVSSSVPWITINSASSGAGSSTVSYSLTANPDTRLRTGTISVAGNLFIVTQTGTTGLIILEDFAGVTFQPSANWTITDGGTNGGVEARWSNQNPCRRSIAFPGNQNGTFAIMDAGCAGPTINALDEYLYTPPFNATGLGTILVEFYSQFRWDAELPDNVGEVDVSIDGGQTWINVLRLNGPAADAPTPNTQTIDISDKVAANPANVLVRMHYTGTGVPRTPQLKGTTRRTRTGKASPDRELIAYWAVDFTIRSPGQCATIDINPASPLPSGNLNAAYSQLLTQTGGAAPITWGVSAGSLPNGLGLNAATGLLSGTPTAQGTFNFTVTATDANSCTGVKAYQLVIGCPSITITPAALNAGTVNVAYNQSLTANGGTPPHSFSLNPGSTLPPNLSIVGSAITGTPTSAGSFSFTLKVTDASACTTTQQFSLIINPAITSNGLQFYPLAKPLRLLDTRPANQRPGPAYDTPGVKIAGLLSSGTDRVQQARVTFDEQSIPANAKAIVGTATVINFPGAGEYNGTGNVTFYPSDANRPEVSNLNYAANQTVSNGFTLALSNTGAFSIFSYSDVHLVVEIVGYYAVPAAAGLYFHPLPKPIRLLETRPQTFYTGCNTPRAPLTAGNVRTEQGRLTCGGVTIPAAAQALVGNLTAVNAAANGLATVYAGDQASTPIATSLAYVTTQPIANAFVTRLGSDGTFKLFVSQTTDILVDISGYYSAEANDVNGQGLLFTQLDHPIRLLETRPGFPGCNLTSAPLAAGSNRVQLAWGGCDGVTIPATAKAINGNATAVTTTPATVITFGSGNVTLYPSTANQPDVSNLNYIVNQNIPNAFTVGLSNDGKFTIFVFDKIDLLIDVSGYFAP